LFFRPLISAKELANRIKNRSAPKNHPFTNIGMDISKVLKIVSGMDGGVGGGICEGLKATMNSVGVLSDINPVVEAVGNETQ
jgi:hypothetical protein